MKETKFKVGDRCWKPKGYKFPGTVVSVFQNTKGETRIVAEMDNNGMLHIFSPEQLELQKEQLNEKNIESLDNDIRKYTEKGYEISVIVCNPTWVIETFGTLDIKNFREYDIVLSEFYEKYRIFSYDKNSKS